MVRYVFFILVLFIAAGSYAQQSMMSNVDNVLLDKLIAAAKANYPKMKVAAARVNVAELAVKKAKLDWLNIVTFTYLYSPNNTTTALVNPSLLNGYQFGFSTSVGNILSKPVQIKSAKEEYKIAEFNEEESALNIVAMVKQRYYTYALQLTNLNWRTKSLEGAESSLKEIKYKFEKGIETFDNYNRAQVFYASTIQTKIEAEAAILIAKSNLEEIIGVKLESIQ